MIIHIILFLRTDFIYLKFKTFFVFADSPLLLCFKRMKATLINTYGLINIPHMVCGMLGLEQFICLMNNIDTIITLFKVLSLFLKGIWRK